MYTPDGSLALQPQLPLLPEAAANLLDRLLESELPAACASLRKPSAGGASSTVVMRTVAQLVTVTAEADMLTTEAALKLTVMAWRCTRHSRVPA